MGEDAGPPGAAADDAGSELRPAGEADILRWAESLAGIAQTGLGFTESRYEQERFEEVLAVAADIRSHSAFGVDAEQQMGEWLDGVGSGIAGYVTPKITVGAIVGDEDDRILLVQRADSGWWLYPTGWSDVGYSPSEVAVKEVHEETGIDCEVIRPIAILDGMRLGFHRVPLVSIVFHCRSLGGELEAHPLECSDVGFFAESELPERTARPELWAPHAFRAIRGEPVEVLFDLPRDPPWRSEPEAS